MTSIFYAVKLLVSRKKSDLHAESVEEIAYLIDFMNRDAILLPTALAWEVTSPLSLRPSVCASVRLFPLYLRNRLTVDLELLLASMP